MVNRFNAERVKSFSESGPWACISGGQHHTVAMNSEGTFISSVQSISQGDHQFKKIMNLAKIQITFTVSFGVSFTYQSLRNIFFKKYYLSSAGCVCGCVASFDCGHTVQPTTL